MIAFNQAQEWRKLALGLRLDRYRYIIWEYFVVEFSRVWPKYV